MKRILAALLLAFCGMALHAQATFTPSAMTAMCFSSTLAKWVPVAALASGTAATYTPQSVALYGNNGASYYPLLCDSSGNLSIGPLAQSGIPVILAPNGTVATNGTVTLGTALPWVPAYAWLRLPAGAVSGGSAGVYYATCTSTTVCQVYTNFVDPSTTAFTPSVPASPVAAVGSNAAYTQTTGSGVVLLNTTVSAGAMGANGSVRKTVFWALNNTANNKTIGVGIQGSTISTSTFASNLSFRSQLEIHNAGDASHQFMSVVGVPFGSSAATSPAQLSVNTANAFALIAQCNMATATDYCIVTQNTDEMFAHP